MTVGASAADRCEALSLLASSGTTRSRWARRPKHHGVTPRTKPLHRRPGCLVAAFGRAFTLGAALGAAFDGGVEELGGDVAREEAGEEAAPEEGDFLALRRGCPPLWQDGPAGSPIGQAPGPSRSKSRPDGTVQAESPHKATARSSRKP